MPVIGGQQFYTFGGYPWSYTTDREGNAVHFFELEVYDPDGGRVLSLRDFAGVRMDHLETDRHGRIPTFLAPLKRVVYRWFDAEREAPGEYTEWCREVVGIEEVAQLAVSDTSTAEALLASDDVAFFNTLDGPDETAVTVANSADNGDAFGHVDASGVTYDADGPLFGSACVRLDSASGSNGPRVSPLSLGDFTFRLYIKRGSGTYEGNLWWEDVLGTCFIENGRGVHWAGITLLDCLPPDTWVRVEAERSGTTLTLSAWKQRPIAGGTPDHSGSTTGAPDQVTQWWIEHEGEPVWVDNPTVLSTAGSAVHAIADVPDRVDALAADIPMHIAAATTDLQAIPPSQNAYFNALNGPDGVVLTLVNSGDYGTPFDQINGTLTYTDDAYEGAGALLFPGAGGLWFVKYTFEDNVESAWCEAVVKVPTGSEEWGSVQTTDGGRVLIDPYANVTAGGIVLQNLSNTGGVTVVPAAEVPIDSWFRVRFSMNSSQVRCRVWLDPASVVADYDSTTAQDASFTDIQDASLVMIGLTADNFYAVPAKPNMVARLQAPVVVAHRGGANLAPENSREALEVCRARGVQLAEIDVHRTTDGGLVLMHNSTIDANTPEYGDPSYYGTAAIQRIALDAGSWFLDTWEDDLYVPSLAEVLQDFGEDLLLLVEVKADTGEETGQLVVDAVLKAGLENRVIVGSFTRDQLDPALAEGVSTCFFDSDAVYDHEQLATDGVEFFGCNKTAHPDFINSAINWGLKVIPYTVNRHHERDALLTAHPGLFGITSDDPWYLDPNYDHRTEGPLFASKTYHDGQLALYPDLAWTNNPRGLYGFSENVLGLNTVADATTVNNGYTSLLMGALCPVPDPGGSYDLTYYHNNDDVAATGNHGHLIFCAETDEGFDDELHNVECYVAMLRKNHIMNLYYQDGAGGFAKLGGDVNTGGEDGWMRIEVRPTTVSVVRTSGENGSALTTLSVTHSLVRGAYVSVGVRDAHARFSKLTLR